MARPRKLTPAVSRQIMSALALGVTREQAAAAGGIHYSTFRRWEMAGEQAVRGALKRFCDDIKRAEATGAMNWMLIIEAAMLSKSAREERNLPVEIGAWQAAAWKLERRFPKMYGRHIQEYQANEGVKITEIVLKEPHYGQAEREADLKELSG